MNANFTSLIEKHLNATLTAAEAAQLAQAMVDDPAAAEHFASLTRLDANLAGAAKEAGRTALYTRRMERAEAETAPAISRRRLAVRTLAAAAGLAVLIGTGWRLIEGPGLPGIFGQKSTSRPAREESSGGGTFAALAGDQSAAEAAAMKRKLRRFFVPVMNVRQQPVSQALATLQQQCKNANDGGELAFTLADNVRQRWPKPEDEPVVSLEIPGISLLTNLELLAAQSGLKTVITRGGVNFEEDSRASDTKERTWTIPLSQATLTAFMNKAGAGHAGVPTNYAYESTMGFSLLDLTGRARPSWMVPPPQVAAIDSGLQQPVTWNDYGLIHSWIDAGNKTTPAAQNWSEAWGLIPQVQAGDLLATIASDEFAAAQTASALPADQALTYDLQDSPAVPSNADSVQFRPDGKQLLMDSASGTVTVLDAATGQLVASAASYAEFDGDTIDLHFLPDIIETTRTALDHPASLTRLLAVHGMPAAGVTWDPETSVLTARGSMQSLRAAHAAAAAIRESASVGVAVDMRVIEWKDGQSPPGANADVIRPAAETAVILTATDAHSLLRQQGASVTSAPRILAAIGTPVALHQMSRHPSPAGEKVPDEYKTWTNADFNPRERLAGGSFSVEVSVEHSSVSGSETRDGVRSPVRSTQSSSSSSNVPDGAWVRIDFPARGDANAATVLLNIQSAEVHAE